MEHSNLCSGQCVYMSTVKHSKETLHADICSVQHEETSFKINTWSSRSLKLDDRTDLV